MASMLYKNSPTRGRWRGAYVKGNLEIHSSDFGGYTYRHSDDPRRDQLFRCIIRKALAITARAFLGNMVYTPLTYKYGYVLRIQKFFAFFCLFPLFFIILHYDKRNTKYNPML